MAVKPQKKKAAPKPATAKMGRPEIFTQELADQILDRMACGATLTDICNTARMPHRTTVRRWIARYPDFSVAYTRARELLADVYAEQVIDIADDATGDITVDASGKPQVNWESVQRSRLKVDARKWAAAKLAPRKYGERIMQQHTGPNDGPIITGSPMLPDEVAAALAALIGTAEREMGLPAGDGKPDAERIEAIKAVNGTLPPTLYDAMFQMTRKSDDAVH